MQVIQQHGKNNNDSDKDKDNKDFDNILERETEGGERSYQRIQGERTDRHTFFVKTRHFTTY